MTRRAARYIWEFTVRTTSEERDRLRRFARQTKLSLSRYLVLAALIGPQPAAHHRTTISRGAISVRSLIYSANAQPSASAVGNW